jgi:uncharacterized protein YecT (DUF1311 family)
MKPLLIASAFGLFAALHNPAQAQGLDCAEPLTQADMNDCASRAFASADSLLNQVWKSAIQTAKGRDSDLYDGEEPSEDMLRQAQRSWIVFRDQACLAESTVARGGSIQPLLQYVCLERLTLNRIEDLEFIADPR